MKQNIVDVDGSKYVINAFKGEKGFKIKTEIMQLAAPSIGDLFKFQKEEDGSELKESGDVIQSLAKLISSSTSDKIFALIKNIISEVERDGNKINFDDEFSCNYFALYKLIYEVLLFNYKDVFLKLGIISN